MIQAVSQSSPPATPPQDKVYLIDGSGYIFRAFYAVAPLSTSQGFPTNALFGYTRMLLKLLAESKSTHVVAVFDAGRETFRTKLYPEYKANRVEMPPELSAQMPYFREISRALGLPVLELPDYEADDIIGTLSSRLHQAGVPVVIVSGDKDMMQLVGEGVEVWDTLKEQHYGPAEVKAKWGVGPQHIIDFLALTGDSSDNIPGLEGIGPKTAVQLIERYGSVEQIAAAASQVAADVSLRNRSKIADQLQNNVSVLRLSYQLASICQSAPLSFAQRPLVEMSDPQLLEHLRRAEPDTAQLTDLTKRFEFSSLFAQFGVPKLLAVEEDTQDWQAQTVWAADFEDFVTMLRRQPRFAVDLETTSLDPFAAQIVGASFCWEQGKAYYVPLLHKVAPETQIGFAEFCRLLKPVLEDSTLEKCGQNLKFDFSILLQQGICLQGIGFDSMIAAYLLEPDAASFNLTELARSYLSLPTTEYTEIVPQQGDFSDVAVDVATRYAAQDALYAWRLREVLLPQLEERGLLKVFSEVEMPLVPLLGRMELHGVRLDVELLRSLSDEFSKELESIKTDIFVAAGMEFNMNSPKQLAEVLFGKLALSSKGLKRTKTGTSTDSSVLEKLAPLHPLPALILRHRLLFKLKSTYVDSLPTQVNPRSGRLHTRFNQTVAATGRLSSSDPNLQNIPIQTKEGNRIRGAFCADPGCVLLSADYSQIELRLLAHMSQDKALLEAFRTETDIHTQTAREVLGIMPQMPVSDHDRRIGKTINFGIVYGMGPHRLSQELGIPQRVAASYIEGYFARYPGVRRFFDQLEQEALEKGYVSTIMGRRRVVAGIEARGRDQRFILRAALNAPIQGSAADLIKLAMLHIAARAEERWGQSKGLFRLVLQVHDELVIETAKEIEFEACKLVKEAMEGAMQLQVPLKVEVGVGQTWLEAKNG
jgi:DNA polymerase-1